MNIKKLEEKQYCPSFLDNISYYFYCLRNYIPRSVRNFWYENIDSFFFPRQKWLTDRVPKTWVDKDTIIQTVLFACLEHYVDGEKCFETIVWDEDENHKKYAAKIQEIYNYIKIERPKLLKEIDNAYPSMNLDKLTEEISNNKYSYQKRYGEVDRLEKILNEKDDEYLVEIVKMRKILWT